MRTDITSDSTTPAPWHTFSAAEILSDFQTGERGLETEEAASRLAHDGPNELPRRLPPTPLQITLNQFRNPLIYVLLFAAGLSLFLGEWTDAGFIALVLVINALIGGYQEWRAEKGSVALERLLVARVSVIRDGVMRTLDAHELVRGDVVMLESGNRLPADMRLIRANGLQIDESALTGESIGVLKNPDWIGGADTVLGDRLNMGFAGTTVIRGRGVGIVVSTGLRTEVGRLAETVLSSAGGKPPLLLRMERFTRVIAFATAWVSIAVGGVGLLRGFQLSEMILFAVALAVAAIPEGLPVAITVALAVATHRMARRGVIVRKLAAVEGLGSCARVASDKTGTMTCNELTLKVMLSADGHRYDITGQGYEPNGGIFLLGEPADPSVLTDLEAMIRAALLCNEADLRSSGQSWSWQGDPTEIALLTAGAKAGRTRLEELTRSPLLHEIPFKASSRYAASYHRMEGELGVMVKGAPERVLEMCGENAPGGRVDALHKAHQLAQNGYRVLALAEGRSALPEENAPYPEPSQLRFLGLVGMIDPPRAGVREAIEQSRQAGVEVSMVTGDHPVTALAISRDLGLASTMEEVMTGAELMKLNEEQMREAIRRIRVFARVSPDQKVKIVEALRANGQFVAVTGDGVNDAPALRTANIGIAMGRDGTDVARDAADIVLSDDNFATIVAGIEEGRVAYNNIRKVITLLIATGAAEVLMVGLCVAMGLPMPLLPVQLLWLNLVTNGIQDVALALEPAEGDELRQPPRPPNERIFNGLMIERILLAAAYMGVLGAAVFQWMIRQGWEESTARNAILLLFVLFENVHIGNARAEVRSSLELSPLRSPYLLGGAAMAFLLHFAVLYFPPARFVLETEPVGLEVWIVLLGMAIGLFVLMEFQKWTWRRRHPNAAPKSMSAR